ncbi:MAG: hypothetical protein GKR97_19550 [Rhizobiaceae bacterium]|nr:hypothetical protein [Rhizobiaceae bacterium]
MTFPGQHNKKKLWAHILAILVVVYGCQSVSAQSGDGTRVDVAAPAELIEIVKAHVWPDTDIVTRMAAQRRLQQLARETPETVVPLLVRELEMLKRRDKNTVHQRIALIETLRDIGPGAEVATNVLIEIVQDEKEPNDWLRMAARMALERIGVRDGRTALEKDSKSRAREFIGTARTEEIRRLAEQSAFFIRQELRRSQPNEGVLTAGLDHFVASGEIATDVLPTLVRAYLDPRLGASAKTNLAKAIFELGMTQAQLDAAAAKPAVDFDPFEDLLADVANPDDFINALAMLELGKLGPSQRAVAALIEALVEKRSPGSAANALGKFGNKASRAVPYLVRYLSDRRVGANAMQAIARIGTNDVIVINELRRIVRIEDAVHRGMAVSTLGKLGVLEALPDLQSALTDKRKYTQILAAQAIAQFTKQAAPAVGDLGKLLEHPDEDVRRAAIEALGLIGSAARPLSMTIVGELHSENDRLRRSAEEAIERIGGPVAESTKLALAEAFRVRDLVAAKNLIAGSKFDDLANFLDQLPSERKLALSKALQNHEVLRVAYIANVSRVLSIGEDIAVRKVIEISLQDQNGPELLQGLTWSIIHGAGGVNAKEVIAKLATELQSQLRSAPKDVQNRFKDLWMPGGK